LRFCACESPLGPRAALSPSSPNLRRRKKERVVAAVKSIAAYSELESELATVQKAHTLVCASLETIQDEQVAPLQAENCRLAAELAAAQKQRDRLLRKARAAQAGLDHGAQCVIPCQDCVCDCPGAGKVKPGRELRATTVAAEIANKGR